MSINDSVEVQLQDENGNWQRVAVTVDISAIIRTRMEEVQRQFSGARVCAVNREGRLLDMA